MLGRKESSQLPIQDKIKIQKKDFSWSSQFSATTGNLLMVVSMKEGSDDVLADALLSDFSRQASESQGRAN